MMRTQELIMKMCNTGNKLGIAMKKHILFVSMLAMTLGFVACSSEDDVIEQTTQTPTQSQGGIVSIVATGEACTGDETEAKTTRTQLGSDGKTVWSDGDEILIDEIKFTLKSTNDDKTEGQFEIENGKSLTTGAFQSSATYDAYYGISGNTLPATQVYSAKKISNAPMHASVTVKRSGNLVSGYSYSIDGNVTFKNLCGLLRLTLKETARTRKVKSIEISAEQGMSGSFTLAKDDYAAKMSSSASKSVVLDCGEDGIALDAKGKDFYISLPPATYSGVKITIKDTEGYECVKTLKKDVTLTITRSKITPAGFSTTFTRPSTGSIRGHEYVDLGTGVLWAKMNIGASKETDNGNYYSWGEITTKSSYSLNDYTLTYNNDTQYTETVNGEIRLKPAYDVAHNWNGEWRMPTKSEMLNLVNKCYWEYDQTNVGYYVYRAVRDADGNAILTDGKKTKDTTRPANERIFLPCAKYKNENGLFSQSYGYYWTATPADGMKEGQKEITDVDKKAYCFNFATSSVPEKFNQMDRYWGLTVRPVYVEY